MGTETGGTLIFVIVLLFHCYDCSCANGKLFGPNCNYMCHCVNGEQCDDITGDCPSGCSVDWMGPGCQYRNIAQKGRPKVSDHNNEQYAKYAVDDNVTSCTDTGSKQRNDPPWWRLTLEKEHYITGLTFLTDTHEHLDQFKKFRIIVGTVDWEIRDNTNINPEGQVCYSHSGGTIRDIKFDIMCDTPIFGNHVRIVLNIADSRLVLCDVRIYGGRNIAFGKAANTSERGSGELGLVVDGMASNNVWEEYTKLNGTQEQWWEINLDGYYLLRGYNILLYNSTDGSCVEIQGQMQNNYTWALIGQTGSVKNPSIENVFIPVKVTRIRLFIRWNWIEAQSKEARLILNKVQFWADCANEFCGLNCSVPCHCQLLKPLSYSDRLTGTCDHGCQPGWTGHGKLCDRACQAGTYGDKCTKNCSGNCANGTVCDTTNGHCLHGCDAGWQGSLCDTGCRLGTYGQGCKQSCSTHCSIMDQCFTTNGTCSGGCKSGWTGNRCDQECNVGTYGVNCQFNCSIHCMNRTCGYTDGHCKHGCTDGWKGHNCKQECAVGKFGPACNRSCSENCKGTKTCRTTDGVCLEGCKPGWLGDTCDTVCPSGFYGSKCNRTCKCDGHNITCHHVDGRCNEGCSHVNPDGRCVTSGLPSTEPKISKVLIGAICVGLVLVLGVIVAVIFIRRGAQNKRQNNVGGNIHTNGKEEVGLMLNTVEYNQIEGAAADVTVDEVR